MPKAKILIKCYGDGLIEVFAEQKNSISLQIIDVPYVNPPDHVLAQDYADLEVRHSHRALNWSNKKIASHWVRPIRPSEIYWRNVELAIVREARKLRTTD
jgi:hypothetical protein